MMRVLPQVMIAVLVLAGAVGGSAVLLPTSAEAKPPRWEYWEGQREIARERREMRREILKSRTPGEARRAYREGMREIARERREMRREVRKAIRRRYIGRIVAGVVLGTIVRVNRAGYAPRPPAPDLCWYWSDQARVDGYWYYCRGD